MLADVLVSSQWRTGEAQSVRSTGAQLTLLPSSGASTLPTFRWRHGRYVVTLTRDVNGWVVRATTSGRLFGPTEVLYEERHADERYACWDVMARVIRATQDEDEGLKAGRAAASWVADHPELAMPAGC